MFRPPESQPAPGRSARFDAARRRPCGGRLPWRRPPKPPIMEVSWWRSLGWICERELREGSAADPSTCPTGSSCRPTTRARPWRTAIEVELTRRTEVRVAAILRQLLVRYDDVAYRVAPGAARVVQRVAAALSGGDAERVHTRSHPPRPRPLGRHAVAQVRASTPQRLLNRTVSSTWSEEWPSHPLDGFDAASHRRRRVSNGHPARAVSRRMPELTPRTRWNATPRLVPLLTLRTRLRRLFSADPR